MASRSGFGSRAVDMLGADARLGEFVPDVERVRDVDGEADGSSPLAIAMPNA